jgi:hypothetical protein
MRISFDRSNDLVGPAIFCTPKVRRARSDAPYRDAEFEIGCGALIAR